MVTEFGERIKERRKSLGLTQDDLAGPNLSRGMISLIERNQTTPSIKTLDFIARKLGVSLGEILGENHEQGKVNPVEAEKLVKMCIALYNSNKVEEAEVILQDLMGNLDDYTVKGEALKLMADIKSHMNMEEAVLLYKESLSYITPFEISKHIEIYYALSLNYRLMNNYHMCIENALYATALIKSNIYDKYDPLLHIKLLYNLGLSYSRIGQYEKGLTIIDEALSIMDEQNFSYSLGSFLMLKGVSQLYLGQIEEGIKTNNLALSHLNKDENSVEIIGCQTNLGILYRDSNDFSRSIQYLERSLDHSIDIGKEWYIVNNYYELTLTYLKFERFNEAKRMASQGLKDCKNELFIAKLLLSLTQIEIKQHMFSKAEEDIEKAISILENHTDSRLLSKCYVVQATIYSTQGLHEKGSLYYQKAAQLMFNNYSF